MIGLVGLQWPIKADLNNSGRVNSPEDCLGEDNPEGLYLGGGIKRSYPASNIKVRLRRAKKLGRPEGSAGGSHCQVPLH